MVRVDTILGKMYDCTPKIPLHFQNLNVCILNFYNI